MVGLVVAGHSRALAGAAVALAREMAGDEVPIEVAAGLDETTFGTDAVAISEAMATADRGDGVVVLMDLGSAVLSAELALDLLPDDDLRERVTLTPAPLVEGLVAAAVVAAAGADRTEVAAEAVAALAGKQSHLGSAAPEPTPAVEQSDVGARGAEPDTAAGEQSRPGELAPEQLPAGAVFTVLNSHGLHARPAARLVATVRAVDARVEIRKRGAGSAWESAASLSRVATLGALRGDEIEVRASGPEARAALDQILALASRAFDETAKPATPATAGTPATGATPGTAGTAADAGNAGNAAAAVGPGDAGAVGWAGLSASPGVAIGPAWQLRVTTPEVPDTPAAGAAEEQRRIEDALAAVRAELRRIRAATPGDAATIFEAHLLLIEDADLLDDVRARIGQGASAPRAWVAAADRVAAEFAALDDSYLRARAADVRAVADQVLRALLGAQPGEMSGDGVLIAGDLTPADAAGLDPTRVAGVLLAYGSPTSHGAILARTRGIPAVVGLGPAVLEIPDGTLIAFDGATAEMVVGPSGDVLADFRERAAAQATRRERAAGRASAPAVTADGITIAVGANLGSVADAHAAVAAGADLAGLVRTEFLFLGRDAAPSVDEQTEVYREIAAALDGRRVTLRTLDVGGDKPLTYLPGPAEANPFLGVRGLRHSLAHPDLLADQLLAIVRVARRTPVSVMFPMVSTVAEVTVARRMLDEAIARTGGGAPAGLHVGIMMEVPAAALKAATFAPYVDFVSIGSNDLTQYALAAERGNAALAPLADGLDPGVLRLIDAVCRGVGGRAVVALCGELGADEAAVPVLVGLGVRELSVAPPAVPAVKEAVRAARRDRFAELLDLPDGAAVRALLRS